MNGRNDRWVRKEGKRQVRLKRFTLSGKVLRVPLVRITQYFREILQVFGFSVLIIVIQTNFIA